MQRKSITTSHKVLACDVCGRTLLRGEHPDAFIAGGTRRLVCDLCTARATHEGWIREGLDDVGTRAGGYAETASAWRAWSSTTFWARCAGTSS